jgi:hypothetical protein
MSAYEVEVWTTRTIWLTPKVKVMRVSADGPGAANDECWNLTKGLEKLRN